ncbi:MAG TPA: 2-oxoglutarate and iron-dependent oxygenase domain-containing protein [Oligoflexus sp.]|uniref:isopenicillin N synthase family dioxygenase n=1 Tax=Oligoflexus sp. TaxID=1971216 RepID=UPI002D7E6853|nr:2-oxoglutarate and iron-dependent oxygenase domain-containing protein [Oligoflexus sp.]HET9237869.1 2-oxoglutarate and iron-dependent oxygenase domain-containing protein [Oligoflexus sp.]
MQDFTSIPIVDLAQDKQKVAALVRRACCESGFFYIVNHGVDAALQERLEKLSHAFFQKDEAYKMRWRMALGGKAWRGYFPVGGELTSGKPDLKEGLYLGTELPADHPKVKAAVPLHGANLFPDLPGFKDSILSYMDAVTNLGHRLMEIMGLSLGLSADYFHKHYTQDPLILFRIFHYPPDPKPQSTESWGVGEHTDYGLLTILKQDDCGGLQVKSRSHWVDAPPVKDSFVCNIGDMLDRMTGGLYKSTPHRVKNVSGRNRYSYPLFFDPGFDTEVKALPLAKVEQDDREERWDKASVHAFQGTYGDYVLSKVSKVFPDLKQDVLEKKP